MQPLKPIDVRRAAMDLLAFREHSVQELLEKLSRRFKKRRRNSDTFGNNTFGSKASRRKSANNKSYSKSSYSNKPCFSDEFDGQAGDGELSLESSCEPDEYNQGQQQEADLDVIVEQVQQLRSENLQSDQRFAESFVRSRVNKGQGPQRIKSEMTARGVAESLATEVLAQAQVDWDEVLVELALRKYRDSAPRDDKERAKRLRFYLYRGFSFEHIKNLDN